MREASAQIKLARQELDKSADLKVSLEISHSPPCQRIMHFVLVIYGSWSAQNAFAQAMNLDVISDSSPSKSRVERHWVWMHTIYWICFEYLWS